MLELKKHDIVLDCDDVLCLIAPKWIYKLYSDYDFFSKYLYIPKKEEFVFNEEMVTKIMSRPFFKLDSWLFKHGERNNFSDEEIIEFRERFYHLYDTPDFYDDLSPTEFAKGMSFAINETAIKHVSIVTRSTYNNRKSKEKFLMNLFNNSNKLDIYYLDPNENKSDVIKTLGNDIDCIADDELSNIIDICKKCDNVRDVNFYVPTYGYNIPTQELKDVLEASHNDVNYYH
jgi:hypothetical protein